MNLRQLATILSLALCVACSKKEAPPGRAVIETYECNRCHNATSFPNVDLDDHCVNCHTAILDGEQDEQHPPDKLARFKKNIVGYPYSPSLNGAKRFNRAWFVDFIQSPHDLRPHLPGSMPALRISETEAETLADFLNVKSSENSEVTRGDATIGRALFESNGCATCHAIGAESFKSSPLPHSVVVKNMRRATVLAPDLRFTKSRMSPEMTRRWLRDPKSVKPDADMPRFELTDDEIDHLVAFLYTSTFTEPERPTLRDPLPLLEREVRYGEVALDVFRKVCWHCHSEPVLLDGLDGGPGNVGGFGYPGKGVNFASYKRITENPYLFEPVDGRPRIVTHMLARHREVAGEKTEYLGMPLGQPPVSMEHIQLVESWIAQGMKR